MSDDIPECDSCGFQNPVGGLKSYTDGLPQRTLNLCQVCAGTRIGNMAMWPQTGQSKLPQDIAWIANRIRKDLLEARHE